MTDAQKAQTDPINDLLTKPIPQKLWHYTSVKGFQEITTTKTIWATDIRFLNDSEEFTHILKVADEVIKETPEIGVNDFPARDFLNKTVELAFNTGLLRPDRLRVFVASFSVAEDQLSQWRGYSYGSTGVSLAFDLSALRPPAGKGILVPFAPCVYDLNEKKTLLRAAVQHFMSELEGSWQAPYKTIREWGPVGSRGDRATLVARIKKQLPNAEEFNKRLHVAMIKTSTELLQVAALSKNPSFHEEQEWRLVLPVLAEKENLKNPPRFRPGITTLIPYIAYPLPLNTDSTVPLVDVILGPGSHVNSTQAAFSFLKSEGIRVIPRESSVPFRLG